MDVRKEDFPVVLQAFEMLNNKEVFIAEMVVHNQAEVDTFTARYSGKLIKAKQWTSDAKTDRHEYTGYKKKSSSVGSIILIILLILIVLVVIGFATGWIQRTFNINF